MKKQMLLSVLLIAIFAIGILSVAVPVRAAFLSSVSIVRPDMVVPGGGIELGIPYVSPLSDGGTIYFYFSKDDEATISSGDIRLTSMKRTDVEDEIELDDLITIFVPTTVAAYDEYYVKVSDSSAIGAGCKVSAESIEVIPEEDWPTITVDPESDTVPTTVDVEGEDIKEAWEMLTADLYWDSYEEPIASVAVTDYTDFEALAVDIPEAFMDMHKILVLLTNGDTLGTFVDFKVEPSVDVTPPATYSVEEDEVDQFVGIAAHGFPKGTIDADTIKYIVKNFVTGDLIETITADHDEVDVFEDDPYKGTFDITGVGGETLATTVNYVSEGSIDLQFKVDTKTVTVADVLFSSELGDPGAFKAKMSATSGFVGDTVTFSAILFPADLTDVEIEFRREDGVPYIFADTFASDANGAWTTDLDIPHMPGGKYDVYVWDRTSDPNRPKKTGTFEILPDVSLPDSAVVEETIPMDIAGDYWATGFPLDASFDTVVIGTGEFDVPEDSQDVTADGDWPYAPFDLEVPHTSGGGKEVTVTFKGVDADGKAISIESSIEIDPTLQAISPADEEGTLVLEPSGDWEDYMVATVFAGNPMKITGMGFLAGESVTLTFSSEDLDYEAKATITDGGKADSDGDLEVVFQVPTGRNFALNVADWDIEVAGATKTNKVMLEDTYGEYLAISAPVEDATAKLFFGLEPDGDLDLTVNVGDDVKVVGCGFKPKSLTLQVAVEEIEVKAVTSSYGYFDTTITIPELQRGTYNLEETETTALSADWDVESKVVLSPAKGTPGATVTASGTGFVEDEDTDVNWPAIPTLATATGDEDGSWTETFTVPDVEPGTYTITFAAELLAEEDYPEVTFFVLGPLQIASLSMPSTVYNGSTITISITVKDYFGTAVSGAAVTGKITPPTGAAVTLAFPATDASGITSATWKVPAEAVEGTYVVDVTASKPEAGGTATAGGSFYVELKLPPTPPVDIGPLQKAVSDLSSDVSGLSSDLSKLGTDVSGLKSDIAALKEAIAAIPIVPVEWIYITAIMAIIAAIAAIAAVVAVYRKIA